MLFKLLIDPSHQIILISRVGSQLLHDVVVVLLLIIWKIQILNLIQGSGCPGCRSLWFSVVFLDCWYSLEVEFQEYIFTASDQATTFRC